MTQISTKPYLLRAIYEWCTDNGFTPYLAVFVDSSTDVPKEFVKNDEIVLNISFDATSGLEMSNDWIFFSARFGGVPRKLSIPVANVQAIYARENGQGMAFEVDRKASSTPEDREAQLRLTPVDSVHGGEGDDGGGPKRPPTGGKKPALKVVK